MSNQSPEYIPLSECKDRHAYKIYSRNLLKGVFVKERLGFIGIREKFGDYYLFTEYHYDTGEPFGTVLPRQELAVAPDDIVLSESLHIDGKYVENQKLFDWLDSLRTDV